MSDVLNCDSCGRAFGYSMLRQGQCKRCWPEGFDLMPEPPIRAYGEAGAAGQLPLGVLWGLLFAFGTAIVWAVNRVFIALAQDVNAIRKKLEKPGS